jgi:hypothetical protein
MADSLKMYVYLPKKLGLTHWKEFPFAGGPGNPSIAIMFYYRNRELNLCLPGLPWWKGVETGYDTGRLVGDAVAKKFKSMVYHILSASRAGATRRHARP